MDTGHPQGHRLGTKNRWGNSHTRGRWGCQGAGSDSPGREGRGHWAKTSSFLDASWVLQAVASLERVSPTLGQHSQEQIMTLELNLSMRSQTFRTDCRQLVQGSLIQYWSWVPLHPDMRANNHLLRQAILQRHRALIFLEEGPKSSAFSLGPEATGWGASGGSFGTITLQWHSPLVLLQSGSKPLLTSQLHGPHVGCPHQPRGQGWSILQKETQTGMSPLCYCTST